MLTDLSRLWYYQKRKKPIMLVLVTINLADLGLSRTLTKKKSS